MKLIEIPPVIVAYAVANNFKIIEAHVVSEFPSLLEMMNKGFDYLRQQNCTEFCIKQIQGRYDFMLEITKWQILIIGFTSK